MVNALKQEIIDVFTQLMSIFMNFLKENQKRLVTLYQSLKVFMTTSLLIHDSLRKMRRQMRCVILASRRRLLTIGQLFVSKKVAENRSFKQLMEKQFDHEVKTAAPAIVSVLQYDHYLREADAFAKRIPYFDEYQMLKQMISLMKNHLNQKVQLSDTLVHDLTTLLTLMSVHQVAAIDDSRTLFLISYVYKKHEKEIEKLVDELMQH